MPPAITVEHVSKFYRLGTISSSTLGADLSRRWARLIGKEDPNATVGQEQRARLKGEEFLALDDVSFELMQGDVVGVIGRNGAGKSTLLKLLSQVTAPTSGRITLRGRIASLLEVGTGFHPELTGRENVFLNGAILGMTREEIARKFDEIVAFSECESFIDTPVKRYSSGMYVRLAFAVAAHLEPEILIVDEILAVGDAQFQRKCLGKMDDIAGDGRTILFVSHSMAAVSALCKKALLLSDGRLQAFGQVAEVAAAYQAQGSETINGRLDLRHAPRTGSGKGRFTSMEVAPYDSSTGEKKPSVVSGCDVVVEATISCTTAFELANVSVEMSDTSGFRLIEAHLGIHEQFLSMQPGEEARVSFRLHNLLLKPGNYQVALWLGRAGQENIDHLERAARLEIHDDVTNTRYSEASRAAYLCRFTPLIEIAKQCPL